MIKRINPYKYLAYYDSPVNIIKVLFLAGYKNQEIKRGYVHLLEHLFLKNNYKFLTDLELDGGFYNGLTEANKMELIIYGISDEDFQSFMFEEILNFDEIIISDQLFENEKKVIEEEYYTLILDHPVEEVEQTIGSLEDIQNFSLDEVNYILSDLDYKPVLFLFSNINKLESSEELENEEQRRQEFTLEFNDGYYQIGATDEFTFGKLVTAFKILKDTRFLSKVNYKNGKFSLSEEDYNYIKENMLNIESRFRILIDTSFSTYWNYLIKMMNYILNKDASSMTISFGKIWGGVLEQEKSLF